MRISCRKDSSCQRKYSFADWQSLVHRRRLVKCQDNLGRWRSFRSWGGIRGCSRATGANVDVLGEGRLRKESDGMPGAKPGEASVDDDGWNYSQSNICGGGVGGGGGIDHTSSHASLQGPGMVWMTPNQTPNPRAPPQRRVTQQPTRAIKLSSPQSRKWGDAS